jgi:hypothetical protein
LATVYVKLRLAARATSLSLRCKFILPEQWDIEAAPVAAGGVKRLAGVKGGLPQ